MLEFLRSSVSGWVAKGFIGLLVISFGAWGIADVFRADARGAAVSVGDTKVTANEYNFVYRRALNTMSRQFNTQLTPEQARAFGLETRVMGEVVTNAVLDENARILNLGLSEETLARLIGEDPSFRGFDGNFDRDRFQQAIRSAQMRENAYVEQRNQVAIRNQIFEATANGDILPKAFLTAAANYASEERKFDVIVLSEKNLAIDPKPTDSDIEKYFTDNKAKYRAPEYRKIVMIKVEPEDLVGDIDIDAAKVKEDYDSRKDKYGKAERRRIQQIVFKDKAKAEEALKSMADGALFETIVSEMGLKLADLDLGLLKKVDLPDKKMADVAFALELNTASKVIEGAFGPVIVRAIEIEPETVTPFEEVKDKIRQDLALQKAADEVINLQDIVEDLRAGGATLAEIAKKQDLKLRIVEAVDASGAKPDGAVISDLPGSAQLLRGAFAAEIGEETDYLNIGTTGYAWYEVEKSTPARDRTLDEVRDRVTGDWRKAEVSSEIGARATVLKERLSGSDTMVAIASEIGTSVLTSDFLKRSGSTKLLNANAVRAGFSGGDKHVALANGIAEGTQVLLKVVNIKMPDSATLTDVEKRSVNESAGNDILEQLVDQLRTRYGVQVNQSLVRLAQTQL